MSIKITESQAKTILKVLQSKFKSLSGALKLSDHYNDSATSEKLIKKMNEIKEMIDFLQEKLNKNGKQ